MIFPIKVPYTVGPDIVKYEGTAFNVHPNPAYLLEKRRSLNYMEVIFAEVSIMIICIT